MGLKETIRTAIVGLVVERPVAGLSASDLAGRLERDGAQLAGRFGAAADIEQNRRVISHIIGIERWCQRRLRVLLGEPPLRDEYDGYRPARELSVAALRGLFEEARRETLALVGEIGRRGVDLGARVEHNQHGPLTARGWLHYINTHANLESRRMQG